MADACPAGHYRTPRDLDTAPDCVFCLFEAFPQFTDEALTEVLAWSAATCSERAGHVDAWRILASWVHGKARRVLDERQIAAMNV